MAKFQVNPKKTKKKLAVPVLNGPIKNTNKHLKEFVVPDDTIEYSTDADSEDMEANNSENEFTVEKIVSHRLIDVSFYFHIFYKPHSFSLNSIGVLKILEEK